jgi:methyl-accepting chemotaxis protein
MSTPVKPGIFSIGLVAIAAGILVCLAATLYSLNIVPAGAGPATAEWAAVRAIILLVLVVLALLGLLTAVLLWQDYRQQWRRQSAGTAAITAVLQRMAEGDLTVNASGDTPATVAIAAQLNMTSERQRELIRNIRAPFEALVSELHNVGKSTRTQLEGSVALGQQLQQSVAALARNRQNTDAAKTTSAQVSSTGSQHRLLVTRGQGLARDLSRASTDVRESVQDTSKSAKRQSELIQSVTTAAEYIQALNTKISVVAINTRIEAERAGEHGKPFLGIAEAMGDLLREAEAEGRKITSEVRMLQNLSAENLSSMETTVGAVVTILEFVERLDDALGEISQGAEKMVLQASSLTDVTAQAATGADEASALLARISEQSLILGESSELSRTGVVALQQSVAILARNLGRIRIDQQESAAADEAVPAAVAPSSAAAEPASIGMSRRTAP